MRHGNQHFAHGDATVLEGVAVIAHIVVVVVRIGKEVALTSKDVSRAEVDFGKENLFRVFHLEDFFRIVFQVLAILVTQVSVHLTVSQDADRFFNVGGAMVGGDDHVTTLFRDEAHHIEEAGMLEPRIHQ